MSSLDRILPFLKPIEDLLIDPSVTDATHNASTTGLGTPRAVRHTKALTPAMRLTRRLPTMYPLTAPAASEAITLTVARRWRGTIPRKARPIGSDCVRNSVHINRIEISPNTTFNTV